MRLVDEVVTLRDRVLVTVEETERVRVTELVLVPDTVTDRVGTFEGRTVGLELGDTVTERVLLLAKLVAMGLRDLVKLRDFVRVTEIVTDLVDSPDGRTVALELGDTVTERVRVLTKLVGTGLRDPVTERETVGTPDGRTDALALGDLVKLRDFDCVRVTVVVFVASAEGRDVTRALGDTVTERVLVLAKLVAMGLRDRVKLRDFVRVTDTVTVMVGTLDGRTEGLELGETVTERVLVRTKLVGTGLRDRVKLRDFVRVTDTVTVMVGTPEGRTEGLELGDPLFERVLVLTKLVAMGLRDLVKLRDFVRVTDTVTVTVGSPEGRTEGLELGDPLTERVPVGKLDGRTVATGLRDLVKLRDFVRVTDTVTVTVGSPEGRTEGLELGDPLTERVIVGNPDGRTVTAGLRDLVRLRDFVRVTDTVTVTVGTPDERTEGLVLAELVGTPDGRTDGLVLGDTVTERVCVLAKLEGTGLRDLVKLRELERVTETVAEVVDSPDPRTEGWELGDTVRERVRVTEMVGEVDLVRVRDTDAEGVGTPEGRTVARELRVRVTVNEMVMLPVLVA